MEKWVLEVGAGDRGGHLSPRRERCVNPGPRQARPCVFPREYGDLHPARSLASEMVLAQTLVSRPPVLGTILNKLTYLE